MAFDVTRNYQKTLPSWMQNLLDHESIDAWSEDPETDQHQKRLNKTSKGKLLQYHKVFPSNINDRLGGDAVVGWG